MCIKDFESESGVISAIKGEIYHAKFDGKRTLPHKERL